MSKEQIITQLKELVYFGVAIFTLWKLWKELLKHRLEEIKEKNAGKSAVEKLTRQFEEQKLELEKYKNENIQQSVDINGLKQQYLELMRTIMTYFQR